MGGDFLVSKDDASTLLRGFRIDGFQYWQVTILIMSKFVGLFCRGMKFHVLLRARLQSCFGYGLRMIVVRLGRLGVR